MSQIFYPRIRRRATYKQRKYGGKVGFYLYGRYRRETQEDCLRSCYYCDRHEDEIGGEEEFELDHFRPYSFPEFETLENDPRNLVWSCHKCNNLKSDKWPARSTDECHVGGRGFIDRFDPSDDSEYFSVNEAGEISAVTPPAQYLIDELRLDRIGLNMQRKVRIDTVRRIREVVEALANAVDELSMSSSLPEEIVQELTKNRLRLVGFLEADRTNHEYLFRRIRF